MKITNNQIFGAYNYLSNLKLSKFDKDTRVAIFKNVGELAIMIKAVQDKLEVSKKELFKDLGEEAQKVAALREEFNKKETTEERRGAIFKELIAFENYFKAEKEFIEITETYGQDEVEIKLCTIDFGKFSEGLAQSEIDFTAGQLQAISFLFNKVE